MKLLLTILILAFGLITANAQKVEVEQTFIDDAAKAFQLVLDQRDAIDALKTTVDSQKKVIADLERASRTPCSISLDRAQSGLIFWLKKYSEAGENRNLRRQVGRILKSKRKQFRKATAKACGYSNKSAWSKILDRVFQVAPTAVIAILLRK